MSYTLADQLIQLLLGATAAWSEPYKHNYLSLVQE
jgi:hypothetical protein